MDQRLGFAQLPLFLQMLGLAAAIFGYDFLLVWAMASNAFFVRDGAHSV